MPEAGGLWTISGHTPLAYGLGGAVRIAREASGCLAAGSSCPDCQRKAGLRSTPKHLGAGGKGAQHFMALLTSV